VFVLHSECSAWVFLKAKLEEADLRLAEIKKEEYEFERDIVKGAANPRTGKANAEKVSKYLEDKLRAKVEQTALKKVVLVNLI